MFNDKDLYKIKRPQDAEDKAKSNRVIWDAEKVEKVANAINGGAKPKHSPFYENQLSWRSANIVYQYADEEIAEIKKCKKDIVYFAETYCYLMTDKGYVNVKLRDYQKDMLRNYQDHRFNITLASRQIGKCLTFNTLVDVSSTKGLTTIPLYEIYFSQKEYVEGKLEFFDRLKWNLYKAITWLENKREKN
jgi:hypothetical protein